MKKTRIALSVHRAGVVAPELPVYTQNGKYQPPEPEAPKKFLSYSYFSRGISPSIEKFIPYTETFPAPSFGGVHKNEKPIFPRQDEEELRVLFDMQKWRACFKTRGNKYCKGIETVPLKRLNPMVNFDFDFNVPVSDSQNGITVMRMKEDILDDIKGLIVYGYENDNRSGYNAPEDAEVIILAEEAVSIIGGDLLSYAKAHGVEVTFDDTVSPPLPDAIVIGKRAKLVFQLFKVKLDER